MSREYGAISGAWPWSFPGPDTETALATNDLVFQSLKTELPEAQVVSMAAIFPSVVEQRRNSERWVRFWKGAEGRAILADLAGEASCLGFSSNAFSTFTQGLGAPPGPSRLSL